MTLMFLVLYATGVGFWALFGLSTFSSRGEFDNKMDALLDCVIYLASVALWPLATAYYLVNGDVFRRKE